VVVRSFSRSYTPQKDLWVIKIQRWDSKLDRLTLVAMNGWIDFRDEWLEARDGRNNIDELEGDDIPSEKVLFRNFYRKLSGGFPLGFQACVCDTAAGGPHRLTQDLVEEQCSDLHEILGASRGLGWASKKRPAVRLDSTVVPKVTKSLSGIASAPNITALDLEPFGRPLLPPVTRLGFLASC
jgi:hypothetical protein